MERRSPWESYFISGKKDGAKGWTSEGVSIFWGTSVESATNEIPAVSQDSCFLPINENIQNTQLVFRVCCTATAGSSILMDSPLYLLKWTPLAKVDWDDNWYGDLRQNIATNGQYVAIGKLHSSLFRMPLTLDFSKYPRQTSLTEDEKKAFFLLHSIRKRSKQTHLSYGRQSKTAKQL